MNAIGAPLRMVRRSRLVIVELDARGEIDSHAAMCLRLAIEDLVTHAVGEIVIDLRDLTAIDAPAIALLHQARRVAAAAGVALSVLVDEQSPAGDVTRALRHCGLRLQPPPQQGTQPRARTRRREGRKASRVVGLG
jgi:anti-anti-sigma factor